MAPQVAVPAEDFPARVALVRLVVGVGEQVRLQVGALVEAPVAHGTLVRRFLHVQDLVDGEGARLAEAFATFGAFEWLFLGVDVSEKERKTVQTLVQGWPGSGYEIGVEVNE